MKASFAIDMNQPGSVLQDFHTLLDFIGADGELVSKKQLVFSAKTLVELNQKMIKPITQDKKRPQQTTFPHIDVIYKCAHLLGFFHYTNEKARKRINLNSSAIKSWNELNLTEQYFTLLEQWLYGDRKDYRSFLPPIDRLQWFDKHCLKRTKDEYQKIFKNEYKIGALIAGLELFGLIKVSHAKPDKGGGWKINSLKLSQVGQYIIFNSKRDNENLDAFFSRIISGEDKDNFFKKFQPSFSELKKSYFVKPLSTHRVGVYIFNVSLHGAWRRIAIEHKATLDELADVILHAFDFDNDHLHSFDFLDTAGKKREYLDSRAMDAEAFTDEIILAKLSLSIKGNMRFVFDFGDWWEFSVLLENVDTSYKIEGEYGAEIIERKGEPPEQYPEWDE